MRIAPALSLLLVLALLLAGCTRTPDEDGGDRVDGGDGGPTTNTTAPGADSAIAPPKEQFVERPEDVDRPGEYALLPAADKKSDATWTVPSWQNGDTWHYRHHIAAGTTCDPETSDKMTGSGTTHEIAVYRIERTEIDCRDDSVVGTKRLNFTAADLLEVADSGYIEHVFVFPMEDGKRWVFARDDGRGSVAKATATARYEERYQWPGTTQVVKAWNVVVEYEGEDAVEMRYWIGVDQKNVLRREVWSDNAAGVATLWFSTTLESYTPG